MTIEQYEKEYQAAKADYDQFKPRYVPKFVKDRYWKALQNLNDAKSADNQNKSRYGF